MPMIARRDVVDEFATRLRANLRDRGESISHAEARNIIEYVLAPTAPDPITNCEHDALTKYTPLTDSDLAPDVLHASDARLAARQSAIQREIERDAVTTRAVADMLSTQTSYVRRLAGQGHLYVSGKHGRTLLFPTWQFVDGKRVPHLRDVLRALPGDMHPLTVATFMTSPARELGNMAPVEWLTTGGDPRPVVDLAHAEAWT